MGINVAVYTIFVALAQTDWGPVIETPVGKLLIVIGNVAITFPHPLDAVTTTFPDNALFG